MKEEFESLESVTEMLAYLVENNEESMPMNPALELSHELNLLHVQAFMRLFGRYQKLNGTERDELEQCADIYNDAENNVLTRQSAMAHVSELFFPEDVKAPEKEIVRKNDSKVYQTPCEDCQGSPTHLVVFKTANRTEEHFLCEDCEKDAHAEDEDGNQE